MQLSYPRSPKKYLRKLAVMHTRVGLIYKFRINSEGKASLSAVFKLGINFA